MTKNKSKQIKKSTKFMVRLEPDIHKKLKLSAAEEGTTIQALVDIAIRNFFEVPVGGQKTDDR